MGAFSLIVVINLLNSLKMILRQISMALASFERRSLSLLSFYFPKSLVERRFVRTAGALKPRCPACKLIFQNGIWQITCPVHGRHKHRLKYPKRYYPYRV